MNIPVAFVSGNKRTYVLQVRGESMIEDGIMDGDNVIVEQTDIARDGDVVAPWITAWPHLKDFTKKLHVSDYNPPIQQCSRFL